MLYEGLAVKNWKTGRRRAANARPATLSLAGHMAKERQRVEELNATVTKLKAEVVRYKSALRVRLLLDRERSRA